MKKILIIDDDKEILEVLHEALEMLVRGEKKVITVNQSEEAMSLIEKEHFDVVITDFRMPKQNGHDIINQCKKQKIKKIILISGEVDYLHQIENVIYYPKPINLGNFINDIEI